MQPFLKWAGNKSAVMSALHEALPAGYRLVEPFAGSCAVMLATSYPEYLIADINPDLINLYRQLKHSPEAVISCARQLFDKRTEQDFYRVRDEFNSARERHDLVQAARFLYLNRHGFRGLCRYNRRDEFNVPFGHYKRPYFPEAEMRAFSIKAQKAAIRCASYEETLTYLRPGDVLYCDPPYDGTFTDYHTAGFNERDQALLARRLTALCGTYPIIVSGSYTARTLSLYSRFTVQQLTVRRSVGCGISDATRSAKEMLAISLPALPVAK